MSFLNNLWADLVDKRLWPVLVVLVLALVAIPLLLMKSDDSSAPSAPPVPSAAVPAASHSVVSVDSETVRGAKLSGSSRDPFKGQGTTGDTQSNASSAPGPATAAPGPATSSPSGAGSSGTGTGASGDTGTSGAGGGPTPVPSGGSGGGSSPSHSPVTVQFGKWGSSNLTKVEPLQALPSRKNPMVVYLGPKDGKAVFLISSDVTLGSNSDCKPSKDVCQKDYVEPGTTVKVTVDYPRTYYKIKVS
jgi:hypothetical protein